MTQAVKSMRSGSLLGVKETKLVLMGAGGVGKTSLVTQYLQNEFKAMYKPTVEDLYQHTLKTPDGVQHTIDILDTAGAHNFPAMRELSIRSGKGFVLVFSVDDLQSFHEAVELRELVTELRGPKIPIVLVGNKSDVMNNRQVSSDMIRDATINFANCRYIETSAKLNHNVEQIFFEFIELVKFLERPPPDTSIKHSRRLSRRLSSLGNIHALSVRRKSSLQKTGSANELERPDDPRCALL